VKKEEKKKQQRENENKYSSIPIPRENGQKRDK